MEKIDYVNLCSRIKTIAFDQNWVSIGDLVLNQTIYTIPGALVIEIDKFREYKNYKPGRKTIDLCNQLIEALNHKHLKDYLKQLPKHKAFAVEFHKKGEFYCQNIIKPE